MKRTPDEAARAAYRLSGVIKSAAYAAGVEPRDAEDIVQLVAVAAARAAEKGDVAWPSPDAFRSWVYIVALRDALRYAERARRDAVGPQEEPEVTPTCEGRYEAIEMLAILRASTTPERWKALTSYARGVPIGEIARRAGLSVPGAYNRIRLARDDMRAALARAGASLPTAAFRK